MRRVLVTGAAGLLGGEVAGRLADAGWAVTALVHRARDVRRNDGRPARVARALTGDVGAGRFGWESVAWRAEAAAHALVVHCAAVTAFGADPALIERVNVGGADQAVAFAAAGGAGLIHVSTAYVSAATAGVVHEDAPPAAAGLNAYARSKATAEERVRAGGVPFVIARPGIIVGDWAEGRVRRFDGFYLLFKAMAEGLVRTMPASAGASLDLVPIDHVASAIVDLAERFDAAAGGTYHLVSSAPTPVAAFPATLASYPGLATPRLVLPEAFAPSPLERRLFDRVAAPYAPYFARDPRFDDTRLRAVTGRVPPRIGADWWQRLIDFCLAEGFITPGRVRPRAEPVALPAA